MRERDGERRRRIERKRRREREGREKIVCIYFVYVTCNHDLGVHL